LVGGAVGRGVAVGVGVGVIGASRSSKVGKSIAVGNGSSSETTGGTAMSSLIDLPPAGGV
jgi:hypothetical protein